VPKGVKDNNVSVGFNMKNFDNAQFRVKLNANLFASIGEEIQSSEVAKHFNVRAEDIGKEVYFNMKIKINQEDPNANKASEIILKAAQTINEGPFDLKSEIVGEYLFVSILSKVGDTHNKDVSKIRDILVQ